MIPLPDRKVIYDQAIFGDNDDVPKIIYDECPWKIMTLENWQNYFDDVDDSNDASTEP